MGRRYSYTFLGQRLRRLDDSKHGHIAIHNLYHYNSLPDESMF